MSHEVLLQIDSKYFCAGLVLSEGVVIQCAPIIKYMRGWSVERVEQYCDKKGWEAVEVDIGYG